jgi:rhamnosyltransferase subunit B
MANILILVHGTEGDVRPLALISCALKSRGHTVTVISHCAYEQLL